MAGEPGGREARTLLSEEAAELLGAPAPVGVRRALVGVVVVAAGVLAWGFLGRIESRVVARGVLEVEGDVAFVRADATGVVRALRVREGDHVAAGAPLLVLDRDPVTAPSGGTVVKIAHLVGERVAAGESLVVIVGSETKSSVRLRVLGSDASRLAPGQKAHVHLGASATSLVVPGTLASIGAPIADAELGAVAVALVELTGPLPFTSVPGVPVAAEIVTGEVTPLEWLLGR